MGGAGWRTRARCCGAFLSPFACVRGLFGSLRPSAPDLVDRAQRCALWSDFACSVLPHVVDFATRSGSGLLGGSRWAVIVGVMCCCCCETRATRVVFVVLTLYEPQKTISK